MICLTPYARDAPILISPETYQQLVLRNQKGWSFSDSAEECLAKLHYLRQGFSEGKLDKPTFEMREKKLILSWWTRDL
ncbi:MAG: hypothetical protein HQM12_14160 [SAR324 cluster bacterium]|nr:hypothetical protein [SAR324 cluster bacterium]